ncbi:MAG: GNAT family N-acetyltransferase [Undibacterium sp.]|nr:GNAT family N-acetyltransferase [Undibacterium sp.]
MNINTDKNQLDLTLIHRYLSQESTWALGIPLATVQRSIENSLCFGGYENGQQIAFARVVSDYATFAYLMDVFVLPEHQGKGHSHQLMHAVKTHPDLQGLRRFMLASSNARGLYQRYGFEALGKPEIMMEINVPNVYQG